MFKEHKKIHIYTEEVKSMTNYLFFFLNVCGAEIKAVWCMPERVLYHLATALALGF
jgi:hypothetical protein